MGGIIWIMGAVEAWVPQGNAVATGDAGDVDQG
jgi:hypothetical protein